MLCQNSRSFKCTVTTDKEGSGNGGFDTSNEISQSRKTAILALLSMIVFSGAIAALQIALPIYSMQVFDRVVPSGNLATLLYLSAIMLSLIICTVIIDGCRAQVIVRTVEKVESSIRMACYAAVHKADYSSIEIFRDVETLRSFLTSPLGISLLDAPWSIVFILAIFGLHPLLGLVTVSAILLMATVASVGHLATNRLRNDFHVRRREEQKILENTRDSWLLLNAMGGKRRLLGKFLERRQFACRALATANERQGWVDAIVRGLRTAVQVLIVGVAAFLAVHHEAQVGTIVASSMLFGRAVAPFERLNSIMLQIKSVYDAWRRLSRTYPDPRSVQPYVALPKISGRLLLESVSYTVPGSVKPILENISFSASVGQLVVIVGSEGSGKSTVAQILVGAAQPSAGVVRLDGTNLTDFEPDELGRQIGFLPADVPPCNGVVADIIGRAEPIDATEVIAASLLADAHDMIQKLPEGYRTIVGPGRHVLSSGQRQKINLARAYYGRPAFIVLDEPTAGLDDRGEMNFFKAIRTLKERGSTVVVVSRHPGLQHLADQLLMLEHGRIALAADKKRLAELMRRKL